MNNKLDQIFDMQEALNKRLGVPDFTLMAKVDRSDWGLKFSRALIHEVIEFERELAFKHWKKNQPIDIKKAAEEAVDCMHFLVSMCQAMGMSADDLFYLYLEKNKVNHERQENGY